MGACGLLSGPATGSLITTQIDRVFGFGEEAYDKAIDAITSLKDVFAGTAGSSTGVDTGGEYQVPWQRGPNAQTTGIAYLPPERPDLSGLAFVSPSDPAIVLDGLDDIAHVIADVLNQLQTLLGTMPEFAGIDVQDRYLTLFATYYDSLAARIGSVLAASSHVSAMQDRLSEWLVAGSVGMSPDVERALRDRATAAASQAAYRAERDALDEYAARGFTLPSGVVDAKVARARAALLSQESTIIRDTMIEAAKWERDTRQFAIEKGIQREGLLQDRFFKLQELAKAVAGEWQKNHIEVAMAAVEVYKAEIEAFGRAAQALSEMGSAAAMALKIEIDKQNIYLEIYKTKLQGELGRLGAEADIQKTRVGLYGEDIKNEMARVGTLTKLEDIDVELKRVDSNIAIEDARLEMQRMVEVAKITVEALNGVARTAAQLASGTLSSLSMSATVSAESSYRNESQCSETYTYQR